MTTIGIVGAGNIGSTLAQLCARAGHEVVLANSRAPETLREVVDGIGTNVRAATVAEAVEVGEILVVSIPLKAYPEVPVDGTAGKVVIDTNNYYPQRDGHIAALDDDSTTSTQLLADHLGQARVVKAFNSIQAQRLADEGAPPGGGRTAIPIAGDDGEAKEIVAHLVNEIGFDTVDTGDLSSSRIFQPGGELYGAAMTAAEIRRAIS